MDQSTHEVRLAHWKEVVAQCQSRPEGMTAKDWMKENGIIEKQYYYWQRRIRSEAYEEMKRRSLPDKAVSDQRTEMVFAEIPVQKEPSPEDSVQEFRPDAVIRIGSVAVALSNSASEELIAGIIKAVDPAC
ncbi:MAG: IS66 family insertion sequence element accessory protein TnpB [Oribacterium sp.]|nr:IS66 family insertion sequence element accessory protein TnpB [Oribacterium sp.]